LSFVDPSGYKEEDLPNVTTWAEEPDGRYRANEFSGYWTDGGTLGHSASGGSFAPNYQGANYNAATGTSNEDDDENGGPNACEFSTVECEVGFAGSPFDPEGGTSYDSEITFTASSIDASSRGVASVIAGASGSVASSAHGESNNGRRKVSAATAFDSAFVFAKVTAAVGYVAGAALTIMHLDEALVAARAAPVAGRIILAAAAFSDVGAMAGVGAMVGGGAGLVVGIVVIGAATLAYNHWIVGNGE
jgi:hypothetical protein